MNGTISIVIITYKFKIIIPSALSLHLNNVKTHLIVYVSFEDNYFASM